MWEDPIVEEVHAIREQLLAQFEGDFHKYCEYVRSLATPVEAASIAQKPATGAQDVGLQAKSN